MSTNLDGTPRNGGRLRADAVTDIERPWMELVSKEGAVGVRDGLIAFGLPAGQAAGLAMWLEDQRRLRRVVSEPTASTYRKILRALDPETVRRAIPGYIKLPRREFASSAA